MPKTTNARSVGVIGLGPAGLAAVKELKNAGCFGVVMGFDRCSRVGGRWSLDSEAYDAGIWKELCTNTTRRHMEFSDFPWDPEDAYDGHEQAYGRIYPHCTEVRSYLEGYAANFDLHPHLRLGTEVTSIERKNNNNTGSGWIITTVSSQMGDAKTTTVYDFDAIVVCPGPQAAPHHPLDSKFENFTGEVLHSKSFRSENDYKDKRVLVIGGNISGSEIASVLAENPTAERCQTVVHSVRTMPFHIQKFTKSGQTSMCDEFFIRGTAWLDRIMPNAIGAKGIKAFILQHWPEQCDGVAEDVRDCGIALTTNYVDQVKEGVFHLKPDVARAEGKSVTFVDGTTEEFDAVICATGYDYDVSFLPESVRQKVQVANPNNGKKVMHLYKHTLVPNEELVDSLAFCGLLSSVGPYFPLSEMQARYIAAVWSGKIPRPGISALEQNAEAATKKRLDTSSKLNQHETSTAVNEAIGDELGVTPTLATAFCEPNKHLVKPLYACFYRTNPNAPDGDAVVATRCRERFDRLVATSPEHGGPGK
mmetsp:Transcript_6805/g.13846  ORF Transcript_6805/g.13846 Transcript_6805/m.13846 type:complete len:533 (-) Transcript_6805:98-1696(-)